MLFMCLCGALICFKTKHVKMNYLKPLADLCLNGSFPNLVSKTKFEVFFYTSRQHTLSCMDQVVWATDVYGCRIIITRQNFNICYFETQRWVIKWSTAGDFKELLTFKLINIKYSFLSNLCDFQKTLIKHMYWVRIHEKVIFRHQILKRSAVQIFRIEAKSHQAKTKQHDQKGKHYPHPHTYT